MKKLAILQDNNALNEQMKTLFENTGKFEVVCIATDGAKGLEAIQTAKPDILITELVLAGIDGLFVIENVKQTCPETKIINAIIATINLSDI